MTTAPQHVHDFRGAGTAVKVCVICGTTADEECAHGHPRTDENTRVTKKGRKCKVCDSNREAARRANHSPEQVEARKAQNSARVLASRARLKKLVFAHYGTKCSCCGESELVFLAIDHIEGGGNEHRKSIGPTGNDYLYRWLRDHGFPEGFQTMCHNCNFAKHVLGECPHKRPSYGD